MKQNLPIERSQLPVLVLIIVMAWCLGCVTMPRHSPQASFDPSPPETGERINLNTATAAELETLPGIGRTVAERIVSHREQYGAFRRPEHLMMVRGISEQKFRALRHRIMVR